MGAQRGVTSRRKQQLGYTIMKNRSTSVIGREERVFQAAGQAGAEGVEDRIQDVWKNLITIQIIAANTYWVLSQTPC